MNNDAIRDFAYAKVLMNMLEELASKYPLSQGDMARILLYRKGLDLESKNKKSIEEHIQQKLPGIS